MLKEPEFAYQFHIVGRVLLYAHTRVAYTFYADIIMLNWTILDRFNNAHVCIIRHFICILSTYAIYLFKVWDVRRRMCVCVLLTTVVISEMNIYFQADNRLIDTTIISTHVRNTDLYINKRESHYVFKVCARSLYVCEI